MMGTTPTVLIIGTTAVSADLLMATTTMVVVITIGNHIGKIGVITITITSGIIMCMITNISLIATIATDTTTAHPW